MQRNPAQKNGLAVEQNFRREFRTAKAEIFLDRIGGEEIVT